LAICLASLASRSLFAILRCPSPNGPDLSKLHLLPLGIEPLLLLFMLFTIVNVKHEINFPVTVALWVAHDVTKATFVIVMPLSPIGVPPPDKRELFPIAPSFSTKDAAIHLEQRFDRRP